MAEAEDPDLARSVAEQVAGVIREKLGA